jgi:hypothetical protein
MEPNKLEKEFRKQLNSREIQPSKMVWGRLDAMLTEAEEKKPKRRFTWIYIAASFVGFLLIGTALFNNIDTVKIKETTPVVLEQKKIKNVIHDEKVNTEEIILREIRKKEWNKVVTNSDNLKKQSITLKSKKEILILNQGKDTAVASSEKKNDQSASTYKYVSAEKLLADVSDVKFELKETDKTQQRTRKSILVDPNALLSGVETELNQSYRESAFDRLNKKFNAIKTVLVNRNYENKNQLSIK